MLIAYVINRRVRPPTVCYGDVIPVLYNIAEYELCALWPSECVWIVPGTWDE